MGFLHSAIGQRRAKRIACRFFFVREAVSATLPHGEVHIRVEDGGMLVDTGGGNDQMLIALAAVLVCYTEE